MLRALAFYASIAPLLAACHGPQGPPPVPRVVERAVMAEVRPILADGVLVGSLATYENAAGKRLWVRVIRNAHGQDLGLIDTRGRVWRYIPHGEALAVPEPDLLRALGLVLGVGEEAQVSLGPEQTPRAQGHPRP